MTETNAHGPIRDRLAAHPYFTSWTDPESGVESFILTRRVAPVQMGFYFTNPSLSPDGRWLWFYAGFPPSPHLTLGVVGLDPDAPCIELFPGAAFTSASPAVAPSGDACHFCQGTSVWRQPIGGEARRVCTLDASWVNHRPVPRLATHLTCSADGRQFLLDGEFRGGHSFVALGDPASGKVNVLQEFPRRYDHAQFSPVDPDLFLIAQDWWRDEISGQYFCYDQRIWLMDTACTRFEPILVDGWYGHGRQSFAEGYGPGPLPSHEWWAADGHSINWVDYARGVFAFDIRTREKRHIWSGPLCHAHSDPSGRYWCADQSPYRWNETPCQVRFFDRQAGRVVNIASALPPPRHPRSLYHIDPHPHFSPRGDAVIYTTTQLDGQVDVAVTPLAGRLAEPSVGLSA